MSRRLQEEEEEQQPIRGLSAVIVAAFAMNLLRHRSEEKEEPGKRGSASLRRLKRIRRAAKLFTPDFPFEPRQKRDESLSALRNDGMTQLLGFKTASHRRRVT